MSIPYNIYNNINNGSFKSFKSKHSPIEGSNPCMIN